MTQKIAHSISEFLYRRGEIGQSDLDVYDYGFEVFLDSALETVMLALLGLLLNQFKHTLLFICLFVTLRSFTGGYHASTKPKCIMTTLLVYISNIILNYSNYDLLLIFSAVAYAVIFVYAPVENDSKILDGNTYLLNKRISRAMGFIVWSTAAVLRGTDNSFGSIATVTLIQVAVLMLVTKVRRRA